MPPDATLNLASDPAAVERGNLLRQLKLLDLSFESEFDELVELAAAICGKPLGAMTLLDEETQLMKARVGFKGSRTMPVRESICQYTVRGTDLFMVEDSTQDDRFHNDSLRDADIRFYAGMPLIATNGVAVGALCVMDTEPATLSKAQQRALQILGRQMSNLIRLRERAATVARLGEERDRSWELFHTVLNNVPTDISLKDEEGRICYYNRAVCERFGITETEWLGKTSSDLWPEDTARGIMEEDAYVMRSGQRFESYLELPERDGVVSFWKVLKTPCHGVNGERMLATVAMDVTVDMDHARNLQRIQDELEEANRKLNSLALTDALTGLWNRRAFDSRLETSVIGSQRSGEGMVLMLIDVDNFKSINDRFGHPYGDVVLRQVAAMLQRVKRAEDVACRFGGEEFAVLLPGASITGAEQLAQRFLNAMRSFSWEMEPVTVSIGLATCSLTCSSDDLVDDADAALYEAKRAGKDRMVCHGRQPGAGT